jgi:hypothetical protein
MQFNLADIVILVIVVVVAAQFWRIRGIAEQAKRYLTQFCEKQELQLISVARHQTRLAFHRGKLDWRCEFVFEFSGNGEDSSQGTLVMRGLQVVSTDLPAYRVH